MLFKREVLCVVVATILYVLAYLSWFKVVAAFRQGFSILRNHMLAGICPKLPCSGVICLSSLHHSLVWSPPYLLILMDAHKSRLTSLNLWLLLGCATRNIWISSMALSVTLMGQLQSMRSFRQMSACSFLRGWARHISPAVAQWYQVVRHCQIHGVQILMRLYRLWDRILR